MEISPELLKANIADSRRKIEQKRRKVRPFVRGRPRGRPITHSGVYFTRPVLLDDATFLKIYENKRYGEPLGAVVRRLIGMAVQKNQLAHPDKNKANPEDVIREIMLQYPTKNINEVHEMVNEYYAQ